MPKILTGIKESIIMEAAALIEKEGPQAFSIKEVAKRVNIGVGTVYNYFPGEISLIDAVMSQYWDKTNENILQALQDAGSFSEAIFAIHDLSEKFVMNEMPVFSHFSKGRTFDISRDHNRFVEPINGYIEKACLKFGVAATPVKIKLAGALLSSFTLSREIPFAEIESAIEKILN